LARSSFKGYWYCRNTVNIIYKQFSSSLKKKKVFFAKRNSSVPNFFNNLVIRIQSGLFRKKKYIRPLMASFKLGQYSFTRKPYFYPFKKRNKKKNKL